MDLEVEDSLSLSAPWTGFSWLPLQDNVLFPSTRLSWSFFMRLQVLPTSTTTTSAAQVLLLVLLSDSKQRCGQRRPHFGLHMVGLSHRCDPPYWQVLLEGFAWVIVPFSLVPILRDHLNLHPTNYYSRKHQLVLANEFYVGRTWTAAGVSSLLPIHFVAKESVPPEWGHKLTGYGVLFLRHALVHCLSNWICCVDESYFHDRIWCFIYLTKC